MTDFETLHPRATDGAFTTKPQTDPEVKIAAPTNALGLSADDVLLFSHAEGDFDATEIGVEGIAVWVEPKLNLIIAEARTDLDFNHLAAERGIPSESAEDWLNEHQDEIHAAFTELNPTAFIDDPAGDWEAQNIAIRLPAMNPDVDKADILRRTKADPDVSFLIAAAADNSLWRRIDETMRARARRA